MESEIATNNQTVWNMTYYACYIVVNVLSVLREIPQVIDEILQSDDKNNDGLLDYIEFSEADRHFIWKADMWI